MMARPRIRWGIVWCVREQGTGVKGGTMNARSALAFSFLPGLILAACASTQELSVRTIPDGAEVFLQRRGDLEMKGSVLGVYGELDGDSFQDEFYSLGIAPVEYEFDLEDPEASVRGREVSGTVVRRFKEGTIRVVKAGYRTVERVVRFSGDRIDLRISMEPENEN